MAVPRDFLSDLKPRAWSPDGTNALSPQGLYIGRGTTPVEVAVASSNAELNNTELFNAWKARRDNRAAPVLLVVLQPDGVALCGVTGEKPPARRKVQLDLAERLCREALALPDRHAVIRFMGKALPSLDTAIPGLTNQGLAAMQELVSGVPNRTDWSHANAKAKQAREKKDEQLLASLGFKVENLDNLTKLLYGGKKRAALAVMLQDSEVPEAGTDRFNSLSPVSYALAKADEESLKWVIMVQGNRLRLYSTSVEIGVGRRSRAETFIECHIPLLSTEHLSFLWLLYSAEALAPSGSLHQILESSQRFAGDLAKRLRGRIYDEVVPCLAQGVTEAMNVKDFTPERLEHTHEMVLTVLFRLLFIAYAEDSDLLPYRFNEAYRRHSLKQKAIDFAKNMADGTPIAVGDTHWQEVSLLWKAVSIGNTEWGVPAYGGGLFNDDPDQSLAGAALAKIRLENDKFGRALQALLVIDTEEKVPGPVDFRSLGVREFGTIYEGLLESELAYTDIDLACDSEGVYGPANGREEVAIPAGKVYLHNQSGARKLSGSYYTKHFAVEHLLDGALDPALEQHFGRLDALDETDAGEAFFDFRVADIAMGSGHFLVAAIDRIEKGMADYLSKRNLPAVAEQLLKLRSAAIKELGALSEATEIESSQLLRRIIARHCIYGVDLNPLSVQLARLAVWIYTFVPGLPMSMLDHRLTHGNSLVGIGTIDEIRERFKDTPGKIYDINPEKLLGQASKPLEQLRKLSDASLHDIAEARKLVKLARNAISYTEDLFNMIAARPISDDPQLTEFPFFDWESKILKGRRMWRTAVGIANKALAGLNCFHFPIAFPEVFLRERPGFDVVLGNPPWEKVNVEVHAFWARFLPGLRGMQQGEREEKMKWLRETRPDLNEIYAAEVAKKENMRRVLMRGIYPGMGSGTPDLYKAFCWRFWDLATQCTGHIGVVLPRGFLSGMGSTEFRKRILTEAEDIRATVLKNKNGWIFSDVHQQYIVAFLCIIRGAAKRRTARLCGPYSSLEEFQKNTEDSVVVVDSEQVLNWSDTALFPVLPGRGSNRIYIKLMDSPKLDYNDSKFWRARPYRELDATQQKHLMNFEFDQSHEGFWPVYKGESFELWNPESEVYYAFADPDPVLDWLQRRRLRAQSKPNSPHSEFSPEHNEDRTTQPCFHPRIAFRDVSNAIDARTVSPALIPPKVFLTHTAPYLLWPRGDEKDQAFLLGILSSVPLDWYARRLVGLHISYFLLNSFPIPRPERGDALHERLVKLAGRLACPDKRFEAWAKIVGVDFGTIDEEVKMEMIHEIDAIVAHLYRLNEKQVSHVFETYREGHEHKERLEAVLHYFRLWDDR